MGMEGRWFFFFFIIIILTERLRTNPFFRDSETLNRIIYELVKSQYSNLEDKHFAFLATNIRFTVF